MELIFDQGNSDALRAQNNIHCPAQAMQDHYILTINTGYFNFHEK
jgi:hypothetical protein